MRSPLEVVEAKSVPTSVIVIASILAPTIAEYTGTGAALEEYAAILGAVVILTIVGVLMVAVKLISSKA